MDDRRNPTTCEQLIAWTVTALTAALVLTLFEWDHYRRVLRLNTLPHSLVDRLVISWLLLAKTLCLFVPLLALTTTFWKYKRRRMAKAIWQVGLVGVVLWLCADLRVQQTTGRHLLGYAGFLLDPTTFRWAGGVTGALPLALGGGLVVIVAAAIIHGSSAWAVRRLCARRRWLTAGHGLALSVCGIAILIVGVVPAHGLVYCTVAVEQVHQSLPFNPLGFALSQANQDEHDRFRLAVQGELESVVAGLKESPPSDEQILAMAGPRPHVVVIVLESLCQDALTAGYLPKMAARMTGGLTFERHYAGSNCSHLGIFTLLCARSPLQYQEAVGKVEPQACTSLHRAGYECNFLTSGTIEYLRMNEFLRRPAFDRVEVCNHQDDWPNDDRVVLRRARQILQSDRPQFVTLFLMSTHFPYRYPLDYERHRPVVPAEQMLQARPHQREQALNRYRNAATFLDDELAAFLDQLDPQKNIIVLTGDHGESIFDDGTLTHWGRLSEAQMRTPLAMIGPGVPRDAIKTATTHADLLPTMLHVLTGSAVQLRHSSGRDMLLGPHADQAWICTQYPSSRHWEGLLVRGPDRLGLKFSTDPAWVQVIGMQDEKARFNPRRRPTIDEAPEWASAVRDEWEKLK